MLKPIATEVEGDESNLICLHWKEWPPPHTVIGESPEVLRASGELTEAQYQQAKVWERNCGRTEMAESCLLCPRVRRMKVQAHEVWAETLDRKSQFKIIDLKQAGAGRRYRRGPKPALAAWVINAEKAKTTEDADS